MSDQELFNSVGAVQLDKNQNGEAWYFGWTPQQAHVNAYLKNEKLKFFADSSPHLTGTGAGKTALLYRAVRQVWGGRDLDVGPQKIGDCVGWAFAGCVDLIACLEVVAGEAERHSWKLRTSTEVLYALSRVEYGDFDGKYNSGSYGRWAAKAVQQGGTISRQRLGSHLGETGDYKWQRASEWGAEGLPDDLELIAREHRIRRASLVRSFEEARDAIANGYPVAVGSSQGFSTERDDKGFGRPVGTWYHCMKFIASRDDDRPGLLCMNSFGAEAHTGPKGKFEDIPDGCFWVDAKICTKMFQEYLDSYALSQFDGYPRQIDKFTPFIR